MDNTTLDPLGVHAKFGVTPTQIIDYLTLVGDTVDNVPGVPKVGPKTAAKWLAQYGSLAEIERHAGEIGGVVGQNLRDTLPNLALSQKLVTLMDDLALPWTLETMVVGPPARAELAELYRELGFKNWLRGLEADERAAPNAGESGLAPVALSREGYETVLDLAHFEVWLATLENAALFAFDTETTSLRYLQARVVGVSFCVVPGHAAYVPFGHDYLGAPTQLSEAVVLGRLKPLLEDPNRAKVGHHAKYDCNVLLNHGIKLAGVRFDTMLESYVLNSTANRHSLDSVAMQHLGVTTISFEDVAGKGAKQIPFNQVPLETAGPYAAEDADICLRLHHRLWAALAAQPPLLSVLQDLEMPLVAVLSRIERRGVLVDASLLRVQGEEINKRLHEVANEAYEVAGETFNMGSPKQIQHILFDKLALPVTEKTPTGQPSTADSVLQELALDYPLPRLLVEHRALSKLKSTYIDRLPQDIDPQTGRVHTSYHQAVAATGRLSSSDPNLQNIPIRSREGRRIRQAFIAPPGRVLMAADYSQIELRIMAHLSGDERLLAAFEQGLDVHRATAAEVFGCAPAQVTDDQRRSAKAINFGLIYGMSAFGLARQLHIERHAAQSYVALYFARYPGVKRYMDEIRVLAHAQSYVETVAGRRLYLPEINSRNVQRRQAAERTAINAPMQGTAADIIKQAMIDVDRWLVGDQVPAEIILQVHDELVLEVDADAVPAVTAQLRTLMVEAASLKVALVVDVGVGQNWDEAH